MRSIGSDAEDLAAILHGVLSLGRRLRAERPVGGVSLSGVAVLSTLRRLGPLPAARLAEAERLQAQSLTRVLGGLSRSGYVERRQSEVDRRENIVAITPLGEATLVEDFRARREWLSRAMVEGLDSKERDALRNAATAMAKLARFEAPTSPP
ncbi:MarR family transcriptional regulator [Roseomonas nepalensis]|uniref:MarR family transcriptional regulator n=1 Tax=Muricoccus nepalensis TaxID=1854500 RepID=A0A502F702_9PROT|nr:MarR family transcriptional regulator [Roseomonas nepalensis]TPG44901.1 MarR family transcriptional regulator [Roseomonas nepalensis]